VRGYGVFYFIAEAFRGLRANSLVNVLAVGTISMAMLIVGFFLILFFNVRSAVNAMGDRLEMSVYLKDGLTQPERDFLQHRLGSEPGVKKVAALSRTEALALLKKELKGQEALIEGLGENPLPDSFELSIDRRFADIDRLDGLAKKISRYPGVEDVSYGKQGAELLSGLYRLLSYGVTALAVLLGVSVVFIISNSVRLALYSRGQEIELMQWIGATRGFIQGPFLVEGAMLAMLGSALAVGILAALYYSLPPEVVLFLSRPNGLDFLPTSVVAYMIIGGGLLGLAGGLVSVSRFLE
jgi:cell division transport system permease protein